MYLDIAALTCVYAEGVTPMFDAIGGRFLDYDALLRAFAAAHGAD